MEELLLKLTEKNIGLKVDNGNLVLNIPEGLDAKELLREVKVNKQELIAYIADRVQVKTAYRGIKKATASEYYELSSSQKRLYFLYEFDKTSLSYNTPQALKLQGALDEERLRKAFNKLVARHEGLRTSFEIVNGAPVQIIMDKLDFSLEHFTATEAEAPSILKAFIRPFELHKPPLVRAGLVKTGPQDHILIVDMHHIITDGVSSNVLVNDFMALYNNVELPALRLQYKDYVAWLQEPEQRQKISQQKKFWLQQFAEEVIVLELPTDLVRPAIKSQDGKRFVFGIGEKETKRLKQIAEAEGATLFMVLLAIYNILLSKLGNQEDVVVGTPTAGRQHTDLENIIGPFLNTLPLRNYPKGELLFSQFLSQVRSGTLACFDNQWHQYETLVEDLELDRNAARNPLFEVMFALENFEESSMEIPGLTLRSYPFGHEIAQFDLFLTALDSTNGIMLNFEYSTEIFSEATIERFANYFNKIVSAVVTDVHIPIADIDMLSQQEKHLLLNTFNNTGAAYPQNKTLVELFEEQVQQTPAHAALIFNSKEISYSELNERSNQLAHYLQLRGIKRGSNVAILIDRSFEMIIGIMGILKAGGFYMPLDNMVPHERVLQMLKDSGAQLLLTENERMQEYQQHIHVADVRDAAIQSMSCSNRLVQSSPDDVAYLIHTSGSTGKPKGVMLRHKGVINLAYACKQTYRLKDNERILQFSTICFDGSVEQIWLAFLTGSPLVLISRDTILDTARFNSYISEHKVTHLDTTPSFIDNMEFKKPNSLRRIAIGGEECTPRLAKKFYKDYELYNEYGPTETTVISISCLVTDENITRSRIPIGRPINNTRVYILGKNRELLPVGITGELYIGGDGLAKGYLHDEALTQKKFADNPFVAGERIYHTGDLAKWLPDGTIEFLGRADNQVKVRGFRVEPDEIAYHLNEHPEIEQSIVLAREKNGNKYLVAYYVSENEMEAGALRSFLFGKLPDYMVPAYYIYMQKLPLTATGKINRKALPDPSITEGYVRVPPANETEQQLVNIWSEILQIDASVISVTKSFFELGGHSLGTISLVNRIAKELNVEVPVKEVFRYQDIRSLSRYIMQARKIDYRDIEKLDAREYYQLSSAQKRLYFLYEFDRISLAYNMPQVVQLEGALDKIRLAVAFNKLIARHESLRTSFEMVKEGPVLSGAEGPVLSGVEGPAQKITDSVNFEIEYFQADEADVQSLISAFIRPFDLQHAPLMRVGLIELHHRSHILMVDMHHIITDGVSDTVLVRDFIALYNNEELPELKLQYRDYAEWQQSASQQERIIKQKDFWLNEFSDEITTLELPADFQRPLIKSQEGDTFVFEISPEDAARLRTIAESQGATMFMMLLSIYNIFLGKLGNQEDVVIGTPTAGRQHADLETIIGMFVNTLPLRNYPRGDISFREFLSEVMAKTLSCFDNQEYQYEDLVDELKLVRDTSRNPLFEVVFSYENYHQEAFTMPGLTLKPYNNRMSTAKFDLTLIAREDGRRLYMSFSYSTTLFKTATIQRFVAYFRKIVAAVAADPGRKISDIEIITEKEKHALLHCLNNTGVGYPTEETIVDLFTRQVAMHPKRIAIEFEGNQLTYQQLNEESNRLAWLLREEGVTADTIVALFTSRCMKTVVAMIAILKAGGAYLPIDVDYPEERVKYMLSNSGTAIMLTTQSEKEIADYGVRTIHLDSDLSSFSTSNPVSINKPGDICYIIYTSGTTGNPKGVMVEHRNLVRLLFNDKLQFDFGKDDVWTMFHSHCFDFSVWEIYGALLYGGRLVIIPKMIARDPFRYLQILKEKGVTVLNQTPSAFYNLIEADKEDDNGTLQLKYVIFGGEALKPIKLKSWFDKYPATKLINMFGITETTVHVTFKEIGGYEIKHNISNIGTPIPTLSAYIFDKYFQLVPQGVPGELFVGGEGVSRGYLNNEALTMQKFMVNPYDPAERLYRSGDLARLMDNGELEYLGRIDNQVKIRGFRIELGEIESQVLKHSQVADVVVIDKKDASHNTFLCAYIVAKDVIDIAALRAHLLARLPDHMVPAYFVQINSIPQTSNGKVNRRLLPEPEIMEEEDHALPRNSMEEMLVKIWASVLKIPEPGINSNFFSIGGDSMKAVKLLSAVKEATDVKVGIADLFLNPTIASFASCMANAGTGLSSKESELLNRLHLTLEQQKHSFISANASLHVSDIEDAYPASDIEAGMIFHALKEPGIYHDQMVHTVRYPQMDIRLLDRALELMTQKHSILRTAFYQHGSELFQVVFKSRAHGAKHFDLANNTQQEQVRIIREYLQQDKETPFQIEEPGLWRFVTYKLSGDTYCVCFICHHAIIDGWSDASFNTELNNIFITLQHDPGFVPDPLQSSYRDYVIDQLVALSSKETTTYWQNELSEYKRFSFELEEHDNGFYTRNEKLDDGLRAQLIAKSKQLNVSMKNLCFSAYIYALNLFSYNNDITAGLVVNNRPEKEDGDKILGCFLNTVPVRITIPKNTSWKEYILSVNRKLNHLKKHDKVSLSRIVEMINEQPGTRNPVIDVMFNYVDFHVYNELQSGASSLLANEETQDQFAEAGGVQDNYLFSLTVDETGGEFIYSLSYAASFINNQYAAAYLDYFRNTLQMMACTDDVLISKRSIMPAAEVRNILQVYNDTRLALPSGTLTGLFEAQVHQSPANIAVIFQEEILSYTQLNERANQLAHYLRSKNVKPGDIVALLVDRSVEMLVGIIGIMKSGAAYLPLDVSQQENRISDILNDCNAVLLLTEAKYLQEYKNNITAIDIRSKEIRMQSTAGLQLSLSPSGIAYIIYTSGSTGKPKGVMVRHNSVVNCIYSRKNIFNIHESERILQFSTISFDASVEQIWLALLSGAAVVLIEKEAITDTEKFNACIAGHRITHLDTTPSFLESMELRKGNSLQRIIAGGEECKPGLAMKLYKDYQLYNEYGPTETTIVSIACLVTDEEISRNRIPIGRPISNTFVYVLDQHLDLLPTGVKGELYIGGEGVTAGYMNDEALTSQKFIDDPFVPGRRMYRTGDMARWLPGGTIEFLGRMDAQVKIRGFRIELGEIENRLAMHPQIQEAVVLAKERQGDNYLVAYYVSLSEIAVQELKQFLGGRLPDYMVPAHYVQLKNLPLTESGKINRRALPELDMVQEEYVAPSDEIEEKLVAIWSEILKIEKEVISVTSSFFALGGHSLKATVLVNNMFREFNVKVPLKDVFHLQSINGLGNFIRAAKVSSYNSIAGSELKEYYKLSSAQKRLYFLYEFDKNSLAYNMPLVVKLEGIISRQHLLQVFRQLIQRHESLRTSFELVNEAPAQKIARQVDFEMEYFQAGSEEVKSIIKNFIRPFNLYKAPLIRAGLVEISAEENILMIDLHHIVSDGVSHNIFISDFISLYKGELLPPLPVQYKSYAEWQQSTAQQQETARQKDFWLNEFSEEAPVLDLPADHSRPAVKDHAADTLAFGLTKELSDALKLKAEQENVTLYMLLLSIYNVMLAKLSNQEDIVVGTPAAGRQHADLDNIIGMFVNTLPIRNYPKGDMSFKEFLSAVKSKTLACFESQAYQYEDLVDALKLVRDTSRNPLFQTMFAYENFEDAPFDIPGLAFSYYETGHVVSKFDITLSAREAGDSISFDFDYCTGLFRKETIQRFAEYFIAVAAKVATGTDIKISGIEILSANEKDHLLYGLNDTAATYPSHETLPSLFAQQVKKYPGNTALIFNEEHITYKELEESSDGLAHYLKTAGVQEGSNVGLLADRSMEMIIAMLAILKAGGTYMPFDTAQPQQRVLHALRESGARFLLTHRDHMQHYNGHLTVIDIFDSSLYNDAGSIQLSSSPENIAYIIHTSGSTGTPKGVMVTHRSVINFITAQQSFFGITEHDRILQFSSISFDASGEQIWMALLSGAALALASKETLTDNLSLNRYISRHRLTHLHATPSFLESIELYDQSSLKRIVAGGEACKMELAEKFCGQYNFYNKYGPTETTITSIECKVEQNDLCGNTIPIGRPINNTQAYILGKNREVLAQGVKGELYIGGAGLAKGYLQEELTHEKFVAHPFAAGARLYRTGDLARWLSNGMIGFEGRIDDQVKIRGFRIEPGEIESRLKEYPGVTNAIVIAKETGDNKQLVAYYTGSATEAGALKGFLAGRLPDYMVPAHYVHLQLIPLTASGKINRRALPEPQLSEDVNYLAPSGPVEEKLATIWSEILRTGTELIGAYSNFFELGGHSLKTTVLANRIFKEFNVEVPLKEIFSRQTISSLSKFIQGSETSQYASIGKAAPKPYYHLTSAQRRLYFLYQLDKTSLAYNVPQVAKLQGTPDAGRLRNAFEKLIARHESLRTYFEVVREEAVQKIAPQVDFHLEMYTGENVDEVITQFIRPFELHKAPLIRAGLMTIAANEHILMIDAHHIIKDGISEGILVRDFMALYNNDPLPALKLQYKDFAEWQRQPAQQQRIAEQKDFWLKEYAEETNKLELPADFLRPVIMSQEGGSAVFTISAAQAKQLRSIAAKKGATLFMLMFAAYNVLLSKLSNQEDIIVGTPIAGRQHADVDNIIGMFVNTLPVHNYPQGKLPFGEFLSLVKSKMLACFDSQSYPYEELIDELKIVRDTSRNPLFDTLFVYQNFEASVLAIPGLTLTSYDSGHNVAKFDLSFAVQEQEDGLLLSFEYAKALFRHETIERFIGYFQKIISAIIANENVQLAEIKILSEREQYRLLSEFNNTRIEYPQHKTVMHLFEEQALKTPDNVAVITGNTRLSYKEISESSGRMAAYLKQVKGIKPGDLVGLLLEREEQLIPAIFGILKAGAAYVPIDPAYPPKRISAIMEDAALSLLITRQRYLDAAIDINCAVMELDTEMQHVNAQQPSLLADVNPGALAYVIYTSGSTGKPKGVMIEHHSLLNTILCLHKKYPLRASDRYLFKTTYTFDVSAAEIFGWFLEGGAVSLLEPGAAGDSFKILEMVYRERITHMNFVPSMFAIFVEGLEGEGIEKLDSLRYIFLAGEALPADLVNRFHALKTGIRLENIYGPTEATIYACGCPIDQLGDSLNVPIGKPLHNTRLYIVDSSHHLQPIGVAGELCIAGDGLARGYLNNETQTKEKFIYEPTLGERLYKTGDLARWMPDGNIEFLGRIDDQVKIRGFRIELGEIENRLKTYEGITQSVVITKEKQGDKFLVAYYVAPQPLPLQELKNLLLSKLPDYMVPAYYVHLLNMPLTPSGKINRKALPHPEIGDNDSYVAPTGDIEKKLAAIWAEVLRTDESRIGAHSNFFEIGGHSLKATRLLFRIQKLLRSNVSLLDVFRFPTIRQFAQRMQLVKDTANENSDLLVLLSPDPAAQHNFFFLHEGSGDVQGYVTFAGLMKGFNCWGIRSLTLRDYIPQNIELPDMARHYISVMKSIQPHGPYYIAGWSYGGTIIYEMANQLETAGEKVEVLLMIDSQFPVTESRSGFSLDMEFTLEADRSLLFDLLEAKPAPLQNAATMKELWERSLDFFEKGGRGLVKIKNMIPEGIRSILPHLDEIGMEDLVMYVNTIRTLERTMIRYQPAAKLQAQLLYIRALQTELYTDAISSYFKKEVMILEVQTGHFNILQPPFAGQIADKVLTLKNSVV